MKTIGHFFFDRPAWVAILVVLALACLPVAVFMDLRSLSDQNIHSQARTLNRVISVFRSYYAANVVGRIIAADGAALPLHTYSETEGGIPIPATLSIELGNAIGSQEGDVEYRFISDLPFENRAPHVLGAFETNALDSFRSARDPSAMLTEVTGSLVNRSITVATPIVMGSGCVACHNTHPESPKTDWLVGDVRGIQSVTVRQPLSLSLWSFKWLLAYLASAGTFGLVFATIQFRMARQFSQMNSELENNNSFLADVSKQISKYVSPQVFRSIFLGEKGVEISTERKKLTVFFSDLKDFTETTERLQPEELTTLLNEYFSEMSTIAEEHGATVDKFIGDALVVFFGDPVSLGMKEDAQACVAMAIAMQNRMSELNAIWLARGVERPLRARMGINTGYCDVGNFGSDRRMDYTVIGGEANLAARLEGIAKPGGIVMSYETWVHVRDLYPVKKLQPVRFKGIHREVTPYEIIVDQEADDPAFSQNSPGFDLFLDTSKMDSQSREEALDALEDALAFIVKNDDSKDDY